MMLSRLIQAVFRGQEVTMTFDNGSVETINRSCRKDLLRDRPECLEAEHKVMF
jgi:hypothetical protein